MSNSYKLNYPEILNYQKITAEDFTQIPDVFLIVIVIKEKEFAFIINNLSYFIYKAHSILHSVQA